MGLFLLALLGFVGWHGARIWSQNGDVSNGRQSRHVLVLGGTPAGIAAALAAARAGSHVTLVEERAQLGGDVCYAMLNMFDVPLENSRDKEAPGGIFGEFYRDLGIAFDISRATELFDRKLAQTQGIRVLRRTRVIGLQSESGRLVGAKLEMANGKTETIRASAIVDASDDADFAAKAGAGFYIGRENANPDRKMQAAGLLFSVQGVDWDAVQRYIRATREIPLRDLPRLKRGQNGAIDVRIRGRRAIFRLGGGQGNYAYEFGEITKPYRPKDPDMQLLSLNLGRQSDGSVVLNTLNILGVDGLSAKSKALGHAAATREIPFLVEYLRLAMPGFERAQLDRIAPELYIRETRHIHGFYALKVEDVRADRAFSDRIAKCSYALDLHPYERGDQNPFGPERFAYTLPLRALVPRRVDGLFVASRSLSATYSAAGSARVIPITMAAGQAAGEAASLCAKSGLSPHQLVENNAQISRLQWLLRASGADIGDSLVKRGDPEKSLAPSLQIEPAQLIPATSPRVTMPTSGVSPSVSAIKTASSQRRS